MNFDWLFSRPIAHRGLHDARFPENSLPAFENAIEHNYNIEMDTQVTKDGVVVVFHDANLKRVCGVDRNLKDCTLEELKTYRLLGTEYTIPTMREFLDAVDGRTGILCEIKGTNPFNHTIERETIKAIEGYEGNIVLQSFNFEAVKYAKKHCSLPVGELCTWASLDGKKARWFPTNFMGKMWICKITHPDFIAYDVKAVDRTLSPNKYILKWAKKLPVLFWTVNSEEKIEDAQKYANNIIFENLDLELVEAAVGTFNPLPAAE